MSSAVPPPTREELLARLDNVKQRAEALRDRLDAHARPKRGLVARRLSLLLGIPLAAAVILYLATSSILFAVLAFVACLVVTVAIGLRMTPTLPGPGTRAWESQLTAKTLADVITARRAERAAATDDTRRGRLDREIAFLAAQLDQHLQIAASGDRSPGRGYIGFDAYSGD